MIDDNEEILKGCCSCDYDDESHPVVRATTFTVVVIKCFVKLSYTLF